MPSIEFSPRLMEIITDSFNRIIENVNIFYVEIPFGYIPIEAGVLVKLRLIILSANNEQLSLRFELNDMIYKGMACNRPPLVVTYNNVMRDEDPDKVIKSINDTVKSLHVCTECFEVTSTQVSEDGKSACLECMNSDSMIRMKMDDNCPICHEEMTSLLTTLECGHFFHKRCINKYIFLKAKEGEDVKCPICRTEIPHLYSRIHVN